MIPTFTKASATTGDCLEANRVPGEIKQEREAGSLSTTRWSHVLLSDTLHPAGP